LKLDAERKIQLRFLPGQADKKLYYEDPTIATQARDTFVEGIEALQQNKFSEAENKIRVSLQLNPTNPDAHLNLAITCVQQGKWDGAQEALESADRVAGSLAEIQRGRNPDLAGALEQLQQRAADLLQKLPALKLRMAASQDLAKKDFDGAIAKYMDILKSFPEDSDTYYNLALAYANDQRFDEGTQAINKALELRPNEADYVKLKEQIADHKENFLLKQARVILEEADKLVQGGSYAEAVRKYEEARPMLSEKNQAVVYAAEGGAYAKMNRPADAEAAYQKAIQIAPDNAGYRNGLAQFYIGQKQYDNALDVFVKGQTGDQADDSLFNLGKQMAQQGNDQLAELAFKRALESNPQHPEACYELGMFYFYNKKDDAGAKEFLARYVETGKDQGHLDNAKNVLVVIEKKIKK
ncbi:MAG: tetratricopeptide repeat protein, partial [Acidobacteriota bacterium]